MPVTATHVRDGAVDLVFAGDRGAARAALEAACADGQGLSGCDILVQPWPRTLPRLFVADMDSTMITVECIDELADYAGVKAEVAAVTERAMRGELDFAAALAARVALLAGLDEAVLARCHDERVRLMPGARALVATLAARGVRCVLVSGGFTHFAARVAREIGFHAAFANTLELADGRLTGRVVPPVLGAEAKRERLLAEAAALGITPAQAVAVGDGANDIPMLQQAGLGFAYRAKPVAHAAADAGVRHGDLTAILHALGIPRADWVA
ncbi:phosphoserine phosphatase SerB [Sphingomonas changnyeongensis]|uniref:Phosphoserine phosphatase n=2 Tax=Sphingomonas changnyeongensis TaxID=2698679 RepID=A0A7Z2NY45_9SPHN|nr:phosphoserine phosphatase SerB [Sphingomonas changnyeongensis]